MTDKNRSRGIKGFSDLRSEETKEEENVNWYTGGEKSGLQVQAPVNKNSLIKDLLKEALQNGTKPVSEDSEPIIGNGYKLGSTSGSSQYLKSNQKKQIRIKLNLWKNGFTVDDSPLRDYYSPQNQEFINKIKKGEIPTELQKYGTDIEVDLIDSSVTEYTEPPKTLKPFSGTGQMLGSGSTPVISVPQNIVTPIINATVDTSQPTTSIQIRLADGQRLIGTFNHSHPVHEIRNFIESTKPSNFQYDLITSFPQKVLSNESQTIKDAGLINSVVIQKKK